MEYTTEIEINAPVTKVAGLLGNHEQMTKWMKEVKSFKALSGKPRHAGSKTLLRMHVGKEVDVVETIVEAELPDRIVTEYEMEYGKLVVESKLRSAGKGAAVLTMGHRFELKGMLKLAAAVMKPVFIKHSQNMMESFKAVAEAK
jgi:uncharacterized protein YndB with AHSA1/START domain